MDLEGYTKNLTRKRVNRKEIKEKVVERILEFKDLGREKAEELAEAILNESKATLDIEDEFIGYEKSGVNMGEFGVGSRGMGDFYVHEKISEVIGRTSAEIDSTFLDDSGAVREDGSYIVVSVDGMHSRLSDFPFLAGFHVTRATLRDIYVMGARPIALLSDIHLADDGDVTKIFDHIAGISSVSEVMGVPLITGSTLRIGGDMVIGDRMTGMCRCCRYSERFNRENRCRARRCHTDDRGSRGWDDLNCRTILRRKRRCYRDVECKILEGV
jgi:Hydrogenase maturation factor